jgi:Flp pilus assembly protein TadG
MMRGLALSFLRDERGAAAVEMALMTPLLLILMFAPFELGNYYFSQHKITKGVRDAARFAARQPFSKYACATAISDATLVTRIKNLARTGVLSGGTTKVIGWDDSDITVTVKCPTQTLDGTGGNAVTTGIYRGLSNAPIIRVETTLDYPSLFRTLGFNTTGARMTAFSESAVMGL